MIGTSVLSLARSASDVRAVATFTSVTADSPFCGRPLRAWSAACDEPTGQCPRTFPHGREKYPACQVGNRRYPTVLTGDERHKTCPPCVERSDQ
jgi:hypothetical protein